MSYNGGKPKSCGKAHGQCYWNDLVVAQTECQKWPECKYLQQTERNSPGEPGKPVWFARAAGETGVDAEIILWKKRGMP